eukprot:TRINITY_DN430_c0_g1_i6.p1 TRINITY_DN430_c0_g1~~TRINITY_DN430_c0_g1_i6.p1  ORF type:complete len:342 (+),score=-4.02 TRINITY_DN430_c0_g1_i6:153-1028(+)
MATSWSSTKYNLFEQQRQQPAVDLLTRGSQLKQDPTRILDLGCGCGNMLPLFLSRFPNASYTGVDNSANMLAQAREVATNGREVNFLERSFQDLSLVDGPVDFLYSNAALHWLDSHESLFPHLLSDDVLVPGGVVCIQVPDTRQMRSHSLAREVASDLGFSPLLKDVHLAHIHHDPEWYYDLLSPLTDTLELWSTTYTQILECHTTPEVRTSSHSCKHWEEKGVTSFNCFGRVIKKRSRRLTRPSQMAVHCFLSRDSSLSHERSSELVALCNLRKKSHHNSIIHIYVDSTT